MEKVGFIDSNNNTEYMNYSEVENYCKQICNDPINKEKFDEFKKDYTYFNPYFDFVAFKMEYIFINPLFGNEEDISLVGCIDDYLYDIGVPVKNCLDYDSLIKIKEHLSTDCLIPIISKSSDTTMGIRPISPEQIGDVLMDPFQIGMMCWNSHRVTANTVFNQILISSSVAASYYYKQMTENITDPLNHLMSSYGFLRNAEIAQIIIGNGFALSELTQNFIEKANNNGFIFYDLKNDSEIKSSEYKSPRR